MNEGKDQKRDSGYFISIEGVDGAGKSTHIPAIQSMLANKFEEVVLTREPGGTPLGEQLRELLLRAQMHGETEALLMFAARREHIAQVIQPALARGACVVTDRFSDASFAYQCGGRGVDAAKLMQLEQWVHPNLQPNLTILFDLPVEISMQRLSQSRTLDKFELEPAAFFEKIRSHYLLRAAENPQRFQIVDASQTLAMVSKSLERIFLAI